QHGDGERGERGHEPPQVARPKGRPSAAPVDASHGEVGEDDCDGEADPRHRRPEHRLRSRSPGHRRRMVDFRTETTSVRVSFLIPAYNEAATIGEVLDRVEALELEKQVIVVDDGSTDDTPAILERWQAGGDDRLVLRQRNRGKGAAIRAAIPHVDGEIAVVQDADMEYDPADVPHLIEPIERGVADVVFGSRLTGGRPQRAYLFWHLVGNRFLSLVTNVLYNTT